MFAQHDFDVTDQIEGINPNDRRNGTIHVTEDMRAVIVEETERVAKDFGVNPQQLYQQVLDATEGGSYSLITSFLWFKRGEPPLRRSLEAILLRRVTNAELNLKKLQLVWATEVYRQNMGIDLEMLYELGGYPNTNTIEERIHAFLNNPSDVNEVLGLLKEEVPEMLVASQDNGIPMDIYRILDEYTTHHGYRDTSESREELLAKWQETSEKLRPILPLASVETPLIHTVVSSQMGASTRAFEVTYRNFENRIVGVDILNPREDKDKFLESATHELIGHRVHIQMLLRAEQEGLIDPGANERVNQSIKEDFAQLVEGAIGRVFRSRDEQSQQTEFRGLIQSIFKRLDGPYALIQLAVRREMENLWRQGKRGPLTEEDALALTNHFAGIVRNWYLEGFPITFPTYGLINNLNAIDLYDGVKYLGDYMSDNAFQTQIQPGIPVDTNERTEKSIDMKTAFTQRFTDRWLEKPEARAVLLMLMAESGRNSDTSTYGSYILNADVNEIKNTLHSWGITDDLI